MRNTDKQIKISMIIVLSITLILIFTCLLGLQSINSNQIEKTSEFLSQMTLQYKTAVNRQIQGDLETLNGMASIISGQKTIDTSKLMGILKKENENNRFIRMGYINADGIADLADIDGSYFSQIDLSHMDYVHEVFKGHSVISDTIKDSYGDGDINIYAVPVYRQNEIIGALCAVNDADIFSDIVDLPSLGDGYAIIVKQDGTVEICGTETDSFQYDTIFDMLSDEETARELQVALLQGNSGSFHLTQHQTEYLANYTPLKINDWYIISIVPSTFLSSDIHFISKMSIVAVGIIVLMLGFLLLFITHIIQKNKQSLEQLAYYDPLCNCFSKNKFLMEASALWKTNNAYVMVYLDVNNFKEINELFGYAAGDAFLIHISHVLKSHMKTHELYYRDNADCFGMLLREQDDNVLRKRICMIIDHITSYKLHPQQHYQIVCNCGIKHIMEKDRMEGMEFALNRTLMALKASKKTYNDNIYVYDSILHEKVKQHTRIENRMFQGIDQEEFEVWFQPKYDILTEKIVGAEALVRWKIDGNIVYPDAFIPILEENGFITKLDMYVFEHVCRYIKEWETMGYHLQINVNQSRLLFYRSNYLDMLDEIISKYEVDAGDLVLEVTESVAMEDMMTLKETIKALHQRRFLTSMDDFGSGYSSLNLLQMLEFDEVKLDRIFLSDISSDSTKQRNIIQKLVELNKTLSIRTVAEGVETREQLEFLRSIGCDIAQGFYFSKPVPKAQFEELLRKES